MDCAKFVALAWMALVLAGRAPALAAGAGVDGRLLSMLSQPTVSPDGRQIAFAARGDIWTVSADGGTAHLLVSDPATESRPLWSPDGEHLAFVSTRTGNGDVYVFSFATGEVRRLTWDDEVEQLNAWSEDGRWIYFFHSGQDIGNMNDVFRVRPEGGTPQAVSADRYVNESFATPSPDGRALAVTAHGHHTSWWRHGHSHIDEMEIWIERDGAYRRVSEGGAKELWPLWSRDGQRVFFVSDRGGTENLWVQELTGKAKPRQVSRFTDGRFLWPALSRDDRTIVFQRNLEIWKLDLASGKAAGIPIRLEGAAAGPEVERVRLTDGFSEFRLSPDGRKMAVVVHGEVFAVGVKEGGPATRVTDTAAAERQIAWAPDSRRLAYASERDGRDSLYLYDFATGQEHRLTTGTTPVFSPDGRLLVFQRGLHELRVLDVGSGSERVLMPTDMDGPPFNSDRSLVWSPDGRWIAVLEYGDRMFRNVRLVPLDGGEPRMISFLAHFAGQTLSWSVDGTFLVFTTGQRMEDGRLARIDLVPRTPRFREDQFRDLFPAEPGSLQAPPPAGPPTASPIPATPATPAITTPRPVEIVFEGIRERLTILPVGLSISSQTLSPDGRQIALVAETSGQSSIFLFGLDERNGEPGLSRHLAATLSPGRKSMLQFSPDGAQLYFLDRGTIKVVSLAERGDPRPFQVIAEMEVDFDREKLEVFDQVWRYLDYLFADPDMHGADWKAERARFQPYVAAVRTRDELHQLINFMIGELNTSHAVVRTPPAETKRTTGRLGLRFDTGEHEASGRLKIHEIVPLGPVAVTREVRVGDYLLAVDGRPLDGRTNLDALLDGKIGRQTRLTVASSPGGAGSREVVVRPVDGVVEKRLAYRAWVDINRAYVERTSGGRLGYVHLIDMLQPSLDQLLLDLDTDNHAREGVVVDIRNNNGGFINAYVIDILMRQGYMSMTYRGFPTAPARSVLGQRALERPTVLITNRSTLSDGENLAEGYRALGLGKVVGEPTAGWLIYTDNTLLVDGSQLRIPFIRITDSRGQDLEGNPRPVDLQVEKPLGEGLQGKDSQLDAAVRELLDELTPQTARPDTQRTPR